MEATAVAELARLLALRAGYNASGVSESWKSAFSDADLLASAFLLSEMGVSTLWVDSPELLRLLRSAGLPEYFLRRTERDLELAEPPSPSAVDAPASGSAAALLLDARCPVPEGMLSLVRRSAVAFLYGARGPAPLAVAPALGPLLDGAVVASLAGISPALWNCTAVALIRDAGAAQFGQIRVRLAALTRDRSMDPLQLAETCMQLRTSLQARGGDEATELRGRVAEQENEIHALKIRLVKQQKALAVYSASQAAVRSPDPTR